MHGVKCMMVDSQATDITNLNPVFLYTTADSASNQCASPRPLDHATLNFRKVTSSQGHEPQKVYCGFWILTNLPK